MSHRSHRHVCGVSAQPSILMVRCRDGNRPSDTLQIPPVGIALMRAERVVTGAQTAGVHNIRSDGERTGPKADCAGHRWSS